MNEGRMYLKPFFTLVIVGITSTRALGLGSEGFGNAPVRDRDYNEWPNLVSVLNDTNRVYSVWVNGAESFYFRGDTESLNEALQRFSLVQADTREVVILPGPAVASSLLREKEFAYDWRVKLHGGLSKVMTRGKGSLIWGKCPTFVVLIGGGNVDLAKIRIPKGIAVVETIDLRRRYTEAIQESDDHYVRGWGAGELAGLDPNSAESVATIVKLLQDADDWVRLNAAGALAVFGKIATPAISALRQAANTTNINLKARCERIIVTIESATNDTAAAQVRSNTLAKIHFFKESLSHTK